MHFGEYELSPSLISLSPLPSSHPKTFQRQTVRPSSWCYPTFNLLKGRSLGFASTPSDLKWITTRDIPKRPVKTRFRFGCRPEVLNLAGESNSQVHYAKGTPSHHIRRSDRLQADGFRVYFTPLFEVLFTFPSRYWFTIGLRGVFSLTGWSRQIHTGFLVSRATQDTATSIRHYLYGAITLYGITFQKNSNSVLYPISQSYNPAYASLHKRFGLFRVRSPLLAESLLFSIPAGTQMFQFPALAHCISSVIRLQRTGLPHSEIRVSKDICSYSRLIAAYHVLHRLPKPRHPPSALILLLLSFQSKKGNG